MTDLQDSGDARLVRSQGPRPSEGGQALNCEMFSVVQSKTFWL